MNEPTKPEVQTTEPSVLELLKRIDAHLQLLTMAVCAGLEQEPDEE